MKFWKFVEERESEPRFLREKGEQKFKLLVLEREGACKMKENGPCGLIKPLWIVTKMPLITMCTNDTDNQTYLQRQTPLHKVFPVIKEFHEYSSSDTFGW